MRKINETVIHDLSIKSSPIIKKYKKWLTDFTEVEGEYNKEMLNINKELLEEIDLCMVDLEDFLIKRINLMEYRNFNFDAQTYICSFNYRAKFKNLNLFLDLYDKLIDIIGYSFEDNIYIDGKKYTCEFLKNFKDLEQYGDAEYGWNGESEIICDFKFYTLTDGNIETKYLKESVNNKEIILISKRNHRQIKVTMQNNRIFDIENNSNIRFPFSVGQPINRNLETWACTNDFIMDGKDTCIEKKIFGIKVSDIPKTHEWRKIYPNKFK